MPQQPPEQPAPRPAVEPHVKQIDRVERLSEFGAQMAATFRAEFMYFWDRADRRAEVPESEAFVHRIDSLRSLTARYLREAAKARHMPPVQAIAVVRTLDLGELLEAGRGLEATARHLRERAREHGWSSGRLAGTPRAGALPWTDPDGWARLFSGMPQRKEAPAKEASRGGWLTGRLHAMVERIAITPLSAEKRNTPPPPPAPGVRRLQAFENALTLVEEVLTETGPRLAVVRQALIEAGAYKPPNPPLPPIPPRAYKVPADLRPLVAPAAAAFRASPGLMRTAMVAVNQWDHATRLLEEFQQGRDAARKVPPEQVGEVLRPFQVDKLKGLIMPLTNLHVTFRGVPGLSSLFTAPAARKLESSLPQNEIERVVLNPDEVPEPEPVEEVKATPPPPRLSAEETSRRRLGLIMTYLTDPSSTPELSDERLVYRLVAEEHAYQEDRVVDLGMRLRLLPYPGTLDDDEESQARRVELQAALDEARQNKAHLQELLGMVAASAGVDAE